MADIPKDLLEQIKKLEELFTVDQAKLKEVTERFVHELEKGRANNQHQEMSELTSGQVSVSRAGPLLVIRLLQHL